MYKEKVTNNIIHVCFETQKELTSTFCRFQEYYESPEFRNKIFTLGQFRDWYSKKYGTWSYYEDWHGFNIPSYILDPFIRGLFDPLTKEEDTFLELFRYRTDKFYIIGTWGNNEKDTLNHEIAHGLYHTNKHYYEDVNKIIKKHNKSDYENILIWLEKKGYCAEVFVDELQAYLSTDAQWMKEEQNIEIRKIKKLISELENNFKKYYKDKK